MVAVQKQRSEEIALDHGFIAVTYIVASQRNPLQLREFGHRGATFAERLNNSIFRLMSGKPTIALGTTSDTPGRRPQSRISAHF